MLAAAFLFSAAAIIAGGEGTQNSDDDGMALGAVRGGWATVSTGAGHTLAINKDGTLWAWGYNGDGQLGIGDAAGRKEVPTKVTAAGNGWAMASAAVNSSYAIKTDGTLWAWGYNDDGQLGLGDTVSRNVPTQIGSATDWATVSGGQWHAVAIKTDGTMYAWGNNGSGQLGLGSWTGVNVPTEVTVGGGGWSTVSAGPGFTAAVKANGELWTFGLNGSYQLGLGDTIAKNVPTKVGTATDWATVSAGWGFCAAIKTNGDLWTWGANANGQLGLGDTTVRTIPTKLTLYGDNWAKVSAGWGFCAAIKTNGDLWTWGSDENGRLGLGGTGDISTPANVTSAGNEWADLSARDDFVVAVKTNGDLWAWGANANGQLGDGTIVDRNVPTLIGADSGGGGGISMTTILVIVAVLVIVLAAAAVFMIKRKR